MVFAALEAQVARPQPSHRMAPRTHWRDVPRCLQPLRPGQHHGRLGMARHQNGRHGAVFPPARIGVCGRQTAGADGAASRTGDAASASPSPTSRFQPVPQNGLPPRRRGGPIMQEIGGSPDAPLLGGRLGNRDSHPPGLGHPRRPPDRNHHPSSSLRPRAKRARLHPDQGNYLPARRQRLPVSAVRHGLDRRRQSLDHRRQHHRMGQRRRPRHRQRTANSGSARQAGASQIIRRNTIRYCGVEGIGGMGTTNTLIEDNLIEWCGWADAERGWEAAGAKFHCAHNLLFRRNVVRHIRHANAHLARQRQRQLPHHQQRLRRHPHRQRRRPHGDEPRNRTRSTTTSSGMSATPSRARPAREDARVPASSSTPRDHLDHRSESDRPLR